MLLTLLLVADRGATAQSPAIIHVGCGSTENDAGAYYAQDLDLFKKHGLTVEITRLPRGPEVQAAVVGGSLQIGDTNVLSLAVAKQRGVNVTVIAPGSTYYAAANPASLLVVSPTSSIKTAKDLNGKTVGGISVGGLDQLYIWSWVDKNGGDVSTLKYVELPPPTMVPALEAGRVDAVSLAEPFLSNERGKYRVLAKDVESLAPDTAITAWFTMSDWAAKNPIAVKAFAAAIGEADQWANDHPDKAAEILNKYMGTQIARIHVRYAQKIDASLVQPILDNAVKYKIMSAPMKAAELISP